MKSTYTFRHMDASDRARAHTDDKLGRLERFEDREMAVDVVFTTEKHEITAEFKVSGAHGSFVVSETRTDLFEAIDVAVVLNALRVLAPGATERRLAERDAHAAVPSAPVTA